MIRAIQTLYPWEVIDFLYQLAELSLQLAQLDELKGCAEVVVQLALAVWRHDSLMEHAVNDARLCDFDFEAHGEEPGCGM
jgi:hypothetical protein